MKITTYDFNRNGRTHKSLGINEVVDDAVANHVDTIAMISSGNYIRTLIGEIRQRGLENRIGVVNLSNESHGIEDCTEVKIPDMWILRDAVEREQFIREQMPSCGKVRDYTDFTPKAYELKAEEMLASNPDYVSLGVGSGKLFLALKKIIDERGLKTRLVGILPRGENGVFNDDTLHKVYGRTIEQPDGSYTTEYQLYCDGFNPQSIADKLVCPYTFFKQKLLESLKEGHFLIEVEDKDFKKANRKARKRGLEAEMSGSAGFVILDPKMRKQYGIRDDASVIVVNTGRGYQWEEQIGKERRRNFLTRGLTALAAVVGVCIGGWIYHNTPSADEMRYADLNGDGIVSTEEMITCHQIVGTYDYNHDKNAEIKYVELKKHPWIDRKTLAEMKYHRDILEKEVIARYGGDIKRMQRVLGDHVQWEYFSDLSWNQIKYLDEVAQFEDLSSPELLRGRLHRQSELHKKGIDVPVWDVM